MEILDLDKELMPVETTAIHIAVNSGQVQGLVSLLDRDCSLIDHRNRYGYTPLGTALHNGRLEAARILIQYGASLDVEYGENTQCTLAQVLVKTPGFYPLLQLVLESNASFQCDVSSLLPALAYEGDANQLEALLHAGRVQIDCRDYLRCTALHYASCKGFLEVVKVLLTYGATVTLTNSSGSTALHLACSAGHLDTIVAILEVNTEPEKTNTLLNMKNIAGHTPITCALSNKHFEVAQYILETHLEHVDLSQLCFNGHTLAGFCFYVRFFAEPSLIKAPFRSSLPCLSSEEADWLLHESVSRGDTGVLRAAVAQGANVECLDYMQQTPLILAAKLGLVQICECLIELGADPHRVDVSGKTPLVYAFSHGKHEVVSYFLSQFSLAELDHISLTRLSCSPAMLAVLVAYFENNKLDHFPNAWLAWLALIAPTAPKHLFSALVNAIAPHDWIHQMLTTSSSSASYNSILLPSQKVSKHPTLPTYIQEEIVGKPPKPRHKLIRSLSQPRKWCFARSPPTTTMQWAFKHFPRPKRSHFFRGVKRKPFSMNDARAKQKSPSVIHEAALHNFDFLKFIVSSCEDAELQEKVLLSKDAFGRTALELVLPQFTTVLEAFTALELREFTGFDQYLREKYTLPESLLFEEALVHYLCVGEFSVCICLHVYGVGSWLHILIHIRPLTGFLMLCVYVHNAVMTGQWQQSCVPLVNALRK